MTGPAAPPCPCRDRTLEDQAGNVIWRAADTDQWCGNTARPDTRWHWTWCEDCLVKRCEHCAHD